MQTRELNDSSSIPVFAFGTATAHGRTECSEAILLALQKGFRHIDTAYSYENEESVGLALTKWGGQRKDVFICSKWGYSKPDHDHDPELELQGSLRRIGVDYLDLYLIHVPDPQGMTNVEAWKKMEDFHRRGLVRSIGLSSFNAEHIEEIAKIWTIKPSVNQVEYHPYSFHEPRMVRMAETCKKYDIAISPFTSLAPLTRFPGGPVDEVVERISDSRGVTAAQVLLAWARQVSEGGPVVTTASKEWQYQQILDSRDVELSGDEIQEINDAGVAGGCRARYAIVGWDIALGANDTTTQT